MHISFGGEVMNKKPKPLVAVTCVVVWNTILSECRWRVDVSSQFLLLPNEYKPRIASGFICSLI